MKVLDLFSGLGGWAKPFRERGHDVTTLDLEPRFGCTVTADVRYWDWRPYGPFDIVLASPPCEAFSVLTIGKNWAPGRKPKTEKAELAMELVTDTRLLIQEIDPSFFFIENPRAMLRTLPLLADLERVTVAYCQYGEWFRKPTDLWGGFPPSWTPRGMCANSSVTETDDDGLTWAMVDGKRCHLSAPRGSRTGIQGGTPWLEARARASAKVYGSWDKAETAAQRAKVPYELALDVCIAAEKDLAAGRKWQRNQQVLWA